jgi:hypothetical protein
MSIIRVDKIATRFGGNAMNVADISSKEAARVAAAGLTPVDSFAVGATLNSTFEVLYYAVERKFYQWKGAYPKVVAPNSTPASSGGVDVAAWVLLNNITALDTMSNVAFTGNYEDLESAPDLHNPITANVTAKPDSINDIQGNHSVTFPTTGEWIEFTKAFSAAPILVAGAGQTITIGSTSDNTFTWEADVRIRMRFVREGTVWNWRAN